jgi:general secretion pathway protein C
LVAIFRLTAPRVVQAVALATAFAGVLVWSSVLLTSAESQVPQVEPPALAARPDTPALQWFSNQPATVDIKVSGLMAGARRAVFGWASHWPRVCAWRRSRAMRW